ncbi:MAG TPA: DUF1786 family protein [Thermodesulfobacteriota bacterium]|jgi:uncharacterized protein (DUF1786 family)|nr:DUF1786 family protein [Thermodesulfobacteriota bacterium]
MKILAIDIGAGTQDILLFDSQKKAENCISFVLPTPSKVFAEKLKTTKTHIYIQGDTIGGGSLGRAILHHIQKGYRVVMEESAAYSIRNDLDEVRSMGIEVGKKPETDHFQELGIQEVNLSLLEQFLLDFGEDLKVEVVALAVQDHGISPKGVSDRAFRFENMEKMLQKDNRPEAFHFLEDSIPDYYLRMRSAVVAVKRASSAPVLVMDTCFSAILGCLDEVNGPSLIVNVGNGHTIAALLIEKKIQGLYEHHTHELTPEKMEHDLRLFVRGELDGKKVFKEGGHGAITLKPLPGVFSVFVTGPNRDVFRKMSFKFIYAAPGGNTMMTGPMGLVRAAQYRFGTKY